MIILHFLKREYETMFVHRFSSSTMPFSNLPKNCFHYWILSGVNLAYWVYRPDFGVGMLGVFKYLEEFVPGNVITGGLVLVWIVCFFAQGI